MKEVRIPRRRLLSFLPALALPVVGLQAASAEPEGPSLSINAVDSLYHYRQLLEQARGDAYKGSAEGSVKALKDCNELLGELREAVKELRTYLHKNVDWPTLQKRFSAIESSLALMQGSRPDEMNSEALRGLPETTASLQSLMKEISSDCNTDPDGHVTKLIDDVYDAIERQNEGLHKLQAQQIDWSSQNEKINRSYKSCGQDIDAAAAAVANADKSNTIWLQEATEHLQAARSELKLLHATGPAGGASTIGGNVISAASALDSMLDATLRSLTPSSSAILVSYYGPGGIDQAASKPNSISITKSDPTLINNVKEIVQNPSYFSPRGSTTQVVNCIAVCWTVWVVYSTDSAYDVEQRKSLIASALYFRLIWGTVVEAHAALTESLQKVYWLTLQSRA